MDRTISKVQKLKTRRKFSLPGSSLVFSPPTSLVEVSSPTNQEDDSESGDNMSLDINVTDKSYFRHKRDDHFYTQHNITAQNKNINKKSEAVV